MPNLISSTKLYKVKIFTHLIDSSTMYVNVRVNEQSIMNQTDINEVVELLNKAIKRSDWELVTEALEYLQDFQDEPQYEEE